MEREKSLWAVFILCAVVGLSFWAIFASIPACAQDMHQHTEEGEQHHTEEEAQPEESVGICPVMREPASKEYSYTYKGKTYYFCCPMCIDAFKKEPEKYISKIKEINLEAYQFGYEPPQILVKKDDVVKISATSRDVTHGIYIKEYNINVSVKKGETKKIEFVADKVGEFDIICSVYCGAGHGKMRGKLIVEN